VTKRSTRLIRLNLALSGFAAAMWAVMPADARAPDPYDGSEVAPVTLPNGVIGNESLLKGGLGNLTPQTVRIAPRVWAILGRSIVNVFVVEGDTGLIVYDTGTNVVEGRAVHDQILEISSKPVKAIIYSHSHYTGGAGALITKGVDASNIGTAEDNSRANNLGIGGEFPELMPIQLQRGGEQMGVTLPATGPDAPVGDLIDVSAPRAFLPVNLGVHDGQQLTVDGVRIQFFTAHTSDAPSLTAWFPDLSVIMNNFYWPVAANLYAPRGDQFRDVRDWIAGVRQIRELRPDYVLTTHTAPLIGAAKIQDALQLYIDYHQALLDQTLRGILKGLGPEDLRHFVRLPARFDSIRQGYAETLSWYPVALYQRALGWYSGDAADLNPVAPEVRSERLVTLLGGPVATLRHAREAIGRKEWSWALELVNYVVRSDRNNAQALETKAALLRKLAQLTPATISHNFYMAQARHIEGKMKRPVRQYLDWALRAADPCVLLDQYRIRVLPERTAEVSGNMAFSFADGRSCGFAIRPGLAEFIPSSRVASIRPAAILAVTNADIARLYSGEVSMAGLVQSLPANAISGDRSAASALASVFELMSRQEER